MAEGLARSIAQRVKKHVCVYSAGTDPAGVHPKAVEVMKEDGIDISSQSSNALEPELLAEMDYVITLCGDARDSCPTVPQQVKHIRWEIPDPVQFEKSGRPEEEVLEAFRETRENIRKRLEEFFRSLEGV